MYKIAILGCENSHADAFIKLIQEGKYPDVEVVGVYTDDESANARMRDNYGVYTAASFDEFVGRVDGVMVTARHGDNHLKYLRPYLPAGIPVFIDKPATASVADARELAALLEKYGNRFSGGSSVALTPEVREMKKRAQSADNILGGYLRAPVDLKNPYGDFWFYSQHLVQMMEEVFGYYPASVRAFVRDGQVNCVYRYDGYDVYAEYVQGNYVYNIAASLADGVHFTPVSVTEAIFAYEMEEYYHILTGAPSPMAAADFFQPVFVIDATIRAIASGNEEKVERL